jgi:hypothetical protein
VADSDLDALEAALGELRAAGWPTSNTPTAMRTRTWLVAITSPGRPSDEVDWLRQCAGWLRQPDGGGYPPACSLVSRQPWTLRGEDEAHEKQIAESNPNLRAPEQRPAVVRGYETCALIGQGADVGLILRARVLALAGARP